ncbi:unnamed protein product [Hyaloperonospora brassicae]|uniref:Uncharacterized protein n=1 Tax=Hyaloperonospora brassicae TaxID=162125 RepID=A0AAV0TMB2_HYABA|nr:unnamed protein product [Hyaloperonospora brassicae]
MWRQELRWMRHVVRAPDHELRLDRWLRLQIPSLPQSFLQYQLRKHRIRLQSAADTPPVKATQPLWYSLRTGSVVAINARLFQSKFQSTTRETDTDPAPRATRARQCLLPPQSRASHFAICHDGRDAFYAAMNHFNRSAPDAEEQHNMATSSSLLLSSPIASTRGDDRSQAAVTTFAADDVSKFTGQPFSSSSSRNLKAVVDNEAFARPQFSDADLATVCLPIVCNPTSSSSATPSPTCVSAVFARDDAGPSGEPSWTLQELQDYLGMLELLQGVCSDAEDAEGDMWLSADCLGQMERLLTSLLPQGV